MPAIVPWVMPMPESPVAMKTLSVAGIPADEGESINRLHHLARPAKLDHTRIGEDCARPGFQAVEAGIRVVGLPGLVILAADNQQIVAVRVRLQAHVVIGIQRVPEERFRNASLWDEHADHILR